MGSAVAASARRPAEVSGVPRGILFGAAALVLFTLVAVAAVRLTGGATPIATFNDFAQTRDLRFTDLPGGGVAVRDAADGGEVLTLAPGSDGFMRATMRGLARERRIHGVGAEPSFRLGLTRDGRLVLTDPATGHLVALDAFGVTNAQAFARLLAPRAQP